MKLVPSRSQWRRWSTPSKMTAIGLYIGVASLILGAASMVVTYVPLDEAHSPKDAVPILGGSALKIDDVIVSKDDRYVNLDIRLRNSGQTAVNVTRADLHVLERHAAEASYQPSASYDLLLEGVHNIIAVAHVLEPNEVDRFNIRVGFTPYNTSCLFKAELILSYNGNKQATSKPFHFASIW